MRRTGWIVLVGALGCAATLPASGDRPATRCRATPVEDRLPEAIAAMAGEEPIWLVDGSFGNWLGPDEYVKSVWVVSRGIDRPLLVTGRRLDGEGHVRFSTDPARLPTPRLELSDLEGRSVIPGGASAETSSRYLFVPAYLVYPSPGCWEITIRFGLGERRIAVEQRAPDGD